MKLIASPATHTAMSPCATVWNNNGAPRYNPAVGVRANPANSNPIINAKRTLRVLNQKPKKIASIIIPQITFIGVPLYVYPGNKFRGISAIWKCRADKFVYAAPKLDVGIGVIVRITRLRSLPQPVLSHAL